MNCNTLKQVRQQTYESFERGADALFNLCGREARAKTRPAVCQNCRNCLVLSTHQYILHLSKMIGKMIGEMIDAFDTALSQ